MRELDRIEALEKLERMIFKNTKVMFRYSYDGKSSEDMEKMLRIIIGNIVSTELFTSNVLLENSLFEFISLVNKVNPKESVKEISKIYETLYETVINEIEKEEDEKREKTEIGLRAMYATIAVAKLLKDLSFQLIVSILETNYEKAGEIGAEIINYDENLEKDV